MIGLLLALAPTAHPTVWANDYCIYRAFDRTPEQARQLADNATGEMTPEAWELTKTHWGCIDSTETDD